ASALAFLGRLTQATAAVQQAIEIGERRRDTEVLNWAHTRGAHVCEISGTAAQALFHAQRAVEFGEISGSAGLRSAAFLSLGRAWLLNGKYPEALDALNRVRSVGVMLDVDNAFAALHCSVLARAYLGMHELIRAREAADRAIARAGESPTVTVAALLARAQVLRATH